MTASDFRLETQIAVDAVKAALAMTQSAGGVGAVRLKGARDLVTAADVTVEDAVRGFIADRLSMSVIGEERGGDAAADGSYWLVDPICGTRNFASGIPLYCVNLALVEDAQITAAVVGDPSTGDVLAAERGRGAWAVGGRERRRLAVNGESETIVIEDSHADPDADRRDRAAAAVADAIRAFRWDIRALSTTLALAYVATARVAAYVLFWTSAIHVGAGSLLTAEAGAIVSDIDGRPWTVDSDSIVASATPALHSELLAITRGS